MLSSVVARASRACVLVRKVRRRCSVCDVPSAPTAPAAAVSVVLALALSLAQGLARLRRQSAQVRLRALQLGGELQELRPSLARTLG